MIYRTIDLTKKLMLASAISMVAMLPLSSHAQKAEDGSPMAAIDKFLEQYRKEQDIKHQKFGVFVNNSQLLGELDVTSPLNNNSVVSSVSYLQLKTDSTEELKGKAGSLEVLANIAGVLDIGEVVILQLDGTEGREIPDELAGFVAGFKNHFGQSKNIIPEGGGFPDVAFIWSKQTGLLNCPFTTPVGVRGTEWNASYLGSLEAIRENHVTGQVATLQETKKIDSAVTACSGALMAKIYEGLSNKTVSLTDKKTEQLLKSREIFEIQADANISKMIHDGPIKKDMSFPVLSLSDGTIMHGGNIFNSVFYSDGNIYQVDNGVLMKLIEEHYGEMFSFPLSAFVPKDYIETVQGYMKALDEMMKEGKVQLTDSSCQAIVDRYQLSHRDKVLKFYVEYQEDKQTIKNKGQRHPSQDQFNADIEKARKCSKTHDWKKKIPGYESANTSDKGRKKGMTEKEILEEKKDEMFRTALPLKEVLNDVNQIFTPDFLELVKKSAGLSAKRLKDGESVDDVEVSEEVLEDDRESLTEGNEEPLNNGSESLVEENEASLNDDSEKLIEGNEVPLNGTESPVTGNEEPLNGAESTDEGNEEAFNGAKSTNKGNEEPLRDENIINSDNSVDEDSDSVEIEGEPSDSDFMDELEAFMNAQEARFQAELDGKEQQLNEQKSDFETHTAAQEVRINSQRSALNHRVLAEKSRADSAARNLLSKMTVQLEESKSQLDEKEKQLNELQADFATRTTAQEEQFKSQVDEKEQQLKAQQADFATQAAVQEDQFKSQLSEKGREMDDQKAVFEKRLADKDQELNEARDEIEALKERLKKLEKANDLHMAKQKKLKEFMNSKAK